MESWESSTRRVMPGGRAESAELPRGPSGRFLCRWCALEVRPKRRTFCSDWCVHEWRLRTDPAYLRDCVYQRDRGVCAKCHVDTVAAWNHIRKLRRGKRALAMRDWGAPPNRSSLWDADHIVPVVLGGGQCDLSNMRTLCLRCHRQATAALRRMELQLST